MAIIFTVVDTASRSITSPSGNVVQLVPSNWDDYSFKTSFNVVFHGEHGDRLELGTVKIAHVGQSHGWTLHSLPKQFSSLPTGCFSLGQDVDYYRTLHEKLTAEVRNLFLSCMADIVADEELLHRIKSEQVFRDSLMRGVSLSVIHGQYRRVLIGEVVLTDFHFVYRDPGDARHAPINLNFRVTPNSKPSTNIHVLIGRNGVGKTTILNNMVGAILASEDPPLSRGGFYEFDIWSNSLPLSKDYFSSVVSVSFSAFDPFIPPVDQPDRTRGVAYFYVGMKKVRAEQGTPVPQPPKTDTDLDNDFLESFKSCLSQAAKKKRWLDAIKRLESDANFADMDLGRLVEMDDTTALQSARALVERMSSGHSIVLLTITKLVDTVEEKTLVLMDEPESHLHPPLLSAFTRALSELLLSRNGVAIIATHSPVVVQEVPMSCVWILNRVRTQSRVDRPERETFGENVGMLTREIFGLEVSKSGFHDMLQRAVNGGGTFESIMHDYGGQLGFEAQAILRSMVMSRDSAQS